MSRSGSPAPANVVAWCILCLLLPSRASPAPHEAHRVGNASNTAGENDVVSQLGEHELWLARVLSSADQVLTSGYHLQDPLARRLAPILPVEGWTFPSGTLLAFQSQLAPLVFGSGAPQAVQLTLLAGYRYRSVTVEAPPQSEFGVEHTGASIMLVDGETTRDQCYPTPIIVPMSFTQVGAGRGVSPLGTGALLRFIRGSGQLYAETVEPDVVFMKGGLFRLCYTPDGTFGGDEYKNAMFPVSITVIGVYSSCMTNGCLEKEPWHCYFSYRAEVEGPCRVDIRLNGGRRGWSVRSDMESRMWWSAAWPNDRYFDGNFIQSPHQLCSDVISGNTIVPDESYLQPLTNPGRPGLVLDREAAAVMPQLQKDRAFDSFTVSACYCPNYDSQIDPDDEACTGPSEFIQSIGVIYYWTVRVCDRENWASCGVLQPPYSRIVPHQPFILRLQCPPGGICAGATHNKLKLLAVDTSGQDEKPFWDLRERCKIMSNELPTLRWLQSDPTAIGVDITGGVRRDYKVWYLRYLLSLQTMGEEFDVCYCDDGCHDIKNFMKVGRIKTVESMSVARWTQISRTGIVDPIATVEFVNKLGTITLLGGTPSPITEGILPFDSIPFSRQVMMKLISFDREALYTDLAGNPVTLERLSGMDRSSEPSGQRQLDAACGAADWSATLVSGPVTEELAKEFIAHIHGGTSTTRCAFSGAENDQAFTVIQAGSLVVCYCGMIGETGACSASEYWVAATRILARGPVGGTSIVFPTTYVVRVDLEGWGFEPTDTLRFIGMTQSCEEDDFNPMSSAAYRLGCPGLNATDCRLPSLFEDIQTVIQTGNNTGVYIERLEIGDYNTTVVFSSDITAIVQHGDTITIDPDSVLLSPGRNRSNWTVTEQFIVSKLTGIIPYADEPSTSRMYPHRVSHLYDLNGHLDTRRLSLPVGWFENDRPPFEFVDGRGNWAVRNRLSTLQELKADKPVTLRMCWGVSDGGGQKYYADAGVVRFADPTNMADAGVYFTSLVQGSVAPAMISFSPDGGQSGYATFHVPTVLRLLFRDTNGMLEPLLTANDASIDPEAEVPLEYASQALCGLLFREMWSNDVDGFPVPRGCYYSRLYQDLASEDGPDQPAYREIGIVFEPRQGLKTRCFDYRFFRGNPCIYTLVFNARIGDQVNSLREDIVSIFTACVSSEGGKNPCGPRYSVLEYGAGTPRLLPSPTNEAAPRLGRMEMSPLGSSGNRPDVLELSGNSVDESPDAMGFEFRAYALDPQLPIRERARLQIFFMPLTIWNIGQGPCEARCQAPDGFRCTDGRGGHVVECQQEAVARTRYETVVSQQKNSLYLRYPTDTEIIPGSAGVAHTLNVTGILLPNQGFFAQQFMAQLRDTSSNNPSMVWISGSVFRIPRDGTTTGRLLFDGPTGSGPKPFAGDRKNELLVRLVLGATLQHVLLPPPRAAPAVVAPVVPSSDQDNDTDASAAPSSAPSPAGSATAYVYPAPIVRLLLPEGYTCFIHDQGQLDTTREIFNQDANADGFLDNYPGFLRSGQWTAEKRECTFTLLPHATIHSGQVFFVRIRVDNPQQPLKRDDPINVWYMSFFGTNMTALGQPVRFISLTEELALPGWAGNVAVIRTLEQESLQPSTFVVGASNVLNVFFMAVDSLPEYSYVLVDSPLGFDFTGNCQVSDLDVAYYSDWHSIAWGEDLTGPRSRTQTLGDDKNCTPDQWDRDWLLPPPTTNFTRAKILMTRRMVTNRFYGFSVVVRNSREYFPSQHDNWKLWVLSPLGYPVAGTKVALQFNPARIDTLPTQLYDRSWGMFADALLEPLQFDFNASLILPTQVPIMTTLVTVYPFGVRTNGILRSVRVIAPAGYQWDLDDYGDFSGSVPGLTPRVCEIFTRPYVLKGNELILPDLVLRVGCKHGFQVRINVPIRPPTRSMNAFYFEIGYEHAALYRRESAGPVLAPPLRVVYDASIYSLCNVLGYQSNDLEFHLRIVTELRTNEGFVFQGDETTRGTVLECWPTTVKGSLPLPPDAQCSVFRHPLSGLPMIILSATQQPFPAGFYAFRFSGVGNPTSQGHDKGYWSMGTFGDVHLYPQLKVLDVASDVPAPRYRNLMKDAGLLAAPPWQSIALGRDDRPGATNVVVFYFRLNARPLLPPSVSVVPLALRGPLGFVFEEFCFDGVKVLSPANPMNTSRYSSITGSFPCEHGVTSHESWCPSTFAAWPPLLEPVDCWGSGSTAMISVPNYAYLEDRMQQAPVAYYGFEADVAYALQVRVKNPFQDYAPTKWVLDFGHEASKPFSSFVLKTFDVTMTNLRPASMTVSSPNDIVTVENPNAGFLPVNIQFMPSTELPAARVGLADIGAPVPFGALQGSITLRAPTGFTFHNIFNGADRTYLCVGIMLEVAGHEPGDLDAKFKTPSDIRCLVFPPDFSELQITMSGAKVLRAGVPYRLVALVRNPLDPQKASPWVLLTHMMKVGMDNEIPVDRYTFSGFDAAPAIARWEVDNFSNEYMGNAEVLSVRMTIRFTRPVLNGDTVIVSTVSGVSMHAGGGMCRRFKWMNIQPPAWVLPLPNSPMATCSCQAGTCDLSMSIMEGDPGLVALLPSQELAFQVSAVNPNGPPDVIDNFWMVQHVGRDGALIASNVVAGWPVYGQLRDLSVLITGRNTRAGSSTALGVEFVPAVWAGVMDLEVHEPVGFNFIDCEPSTPLQVVRTLTRGSRLVVSNGNFPGGQRSVIQLSQVVLGITGGQTRISILLYEELLQTPVNRRLNSLQGFRAPGGFSIVEQRLWSQDVVDHHEGGRYDEVVPQLPPHSGQIARLDLFFNTTNGAVAGEEIIIRSIINYQTAGAASAGTRFQPRVDVDRPASLVACRRGDSPARCTEPVELGLSQVSVVVDQLDLFPYGVDMQLNSSSPIEAGRLHRLSFWLIPSQGVLYWGASTKEVNGQLATNTNDGSTVAAAAVAELTIRVELFAARNPPQSVVPVRIVVIATESSKDFSLIRVIMPRGYVQLGMTPPNDPQSAARMVVNVERSAGSGDPLSKSGWRCDMQIVTPRRNVSDTRWFVLASGPGHDQWGQPSLSHNRMLGWGMAPGFIVAALTVHFVYAGVPIFTGWLSVTFQLPTYMQGKYVLIGPPTGMQLSCPAGANFFPLVCSRIVNYRSASVGDTSRTINVTLPSGTIEGTNRLYVFMMGITTPEIVTGDNMWDMRVVDADLNTVDSALGVPGRSLMRSTLVQNPTLAWDREPMSGETSIATVEITFQTRIRYIKAFLISLPERFRHDIQHPNQFKCLNKHLPLAVNVEWRNYDNVRWVRILLATTDPGGGLDFVPAGTFQFRFPVMIPVVQPAATEWYFSMCSSFDCVSPDDQHIVVTFPIPNTRPILPARVFSAGGLTPTTIALTAGVAHVTRPSWLLSALGCLWTAVLVGHGRAAGGGG